ncbi:MAG: archaetidylinositol phosphate synthase [Methanobacteriaceae archaeon]
MLNQLRPFLKKILEPIAKKLNVNPNIITIISLVLAIISAYLFSIGNPFYLIGAGGFILFSGVLDVIDGAVARYHNKTSPFGAFLDSTIDRFADGVIIIGIAIGGYVNWIIAVLAIHASITTSYVRARAESQGAKCDVGILERAERLIILIIATITTGVLFELNIVVPVNIIELAMIIIVILGYITVIQRIIYTKKQLR